MQYLMDYFNVSSNIIIGNIFSFAGFTVGVYSFLLVQCRKVNVMLYNAINIAFSILMILSYIFIPNVGAIVLEVFWLIMSVVALVRSIINDKKEKNSKERCNWEI